MNNKKILALVLAFAMMFSSISVVFADTTATIGTDAAALKTMGVLQGENSTGVTTEYLAKTTTRMQAAIMFLRLKGLEDEAMAFTGTANFADASSMTWAQGKAIMAYLKANPQLGWVGADAGKFNPLASITVNQYYKVMLEALGYKQTTAEVVGDFAWNDVMTFAASKGLVKLAANTNFTNNDVAIATIEALKTNVKATTTTLATVMVDAGMINKAAAIAAGVYVEVPSTVNGTIDTVKAIGNSVVEIVFEDDVNAAAAGNKANYTIEGLAINAAVVAGSDTVRLETAAMTTGKLYTLTMGTATVKFSGIAKVADGPQITDAVSEDVEEVVITFDRNIDFATGTNVANYVIAGVQIVKAEVDGDEVTLTTSGLVNRTKYTVKANNVKSIDGVVKKSSSDTFTSNVDKVAPKLDGEIEVQTNERIVVTFNEKITEASAENLANYSIKVDETNGADLEIISATWDSDDENKVEIVTEPMEKREDYKLSVINIADQRKVANVMTRPATKVYEAIAADETAPVWNAITVLSPTTILVEYTDGSKIDEASALDLNNYELEGLQIDSIKTIKNDWKLFRALLTVEEMETGSSYDLTIADVTDEFGNALKEKTMVAKAVAGSLASAKLTSVVATGENTITLTFDKQVDEATAENIANYTIDESVGAPTKATLKTATTVELEVNDLVNGYGEYDLTVNGVEDLAGNSLYFKKKVDTTTVWNTTAPKLEDANILNKYVVALTFDERVDFEADTRLILAVDGDVNDTVELVANEVVEDGTVVEFAGSALDTNKTYTVVGVVYGVGDADGAIKDLVNNAFLSSTITLGDYEFEGIADEPDAAEVVSYEQVNGTTIEVTMSRFVDVTDATQSANGVNFTVTVDEDVVTFAGDKALEEDEDYTFDFASFLEDKHGFAVANSDTDTTTVLTAEDTDTVNPEIDSVVAKNRETIKITFSENIPAGVVQTTDFTLMNYDLDSAIAITGVVDTTVGDNVIELTLAKPMESRYEYELTLKNASIADFVNLKNEAAATFYFNGTNLAK
jgi:hypothetical protein